MVPSTNIKTSPSIVHGGQVFRNVYATSTSTTIPNNVPYEIDESISAQMNRRMDEMMRQFQQVQASLNSSCVPKIPRERHAIVCYSCRVVGHITSRCPQRRQGGWGRGMYKVQGGQGLPSNNIVEGVSGVTLPTHTGTSSPS